MNNYKIMFSTQLAIFAFCLGSTTFVEAQSSDSSAENGAIKLEEILVTARRKEESIQSVPVSINALSSQDLLEATISTTTDLQQNVPGVFLAGSGGPNNPVYAIRGQSKGLLGTSSPAVVSYFAEVPQPSWGSAVPQFDMASVQVLKGPQGTLFGRNTTGGAILYGPQAPSHESGGYVGLTLGDESHQRIQAAVDIPLVKDKVALRLAGDINKRDGYTKNIGVGEDLDELDTTTLRASLLVEGEKLTNTLIFDYFESEDNGFNNSLVEAFQPSAINALGITDQILAQEAAAQARGPFVNESSFAQYSRNERTSIVNRTEYEFNENLTLVNIFGHQSTDLEYAPNIDGLPLVSSPVVAAGFAASGLTPTFVDTSLVKAVLVDRTKQISNELQLKGSSLNDRLDWIVGAFLLKSEPDGAGQINGTTVFQSEIGFVHPLAGPLTVLTSNAGPQYLFLTDKSKALYAHGEYDLTDNLGLEIGVRYTEDEIDACIGTGTTALFNGSAHDVLAESDCRSGNSSQITNTGVVSLKSDQTTWSLGLNWQVNDDVFAYAVTRHGYRAGGANGPIFGGTLAPYQTFEPEEVDDFEFGIKADWTLGNMPVRTNVTYFNGDFSNAQGDIGGGVTTPTRGCGPGNLGPDGDCDNSNDPTGGALVLNVGDTSVDGVELEVVLMPTDNLSITLNGTFQNANIDRLFVQPNPFIDARKTGADPFLYFADDTIQLNVRYAVPLSSWADQAVFNVNYYDTSEAVKGDIEIPAYDLVNFRVDLKNVVRENLDLSLFVNNVTDEEYAISSAASSRALGIGTFIFGPPRLWGVEARYSF